MSDLVGRVRVAQLVDGLAPSLFADTGLRGMAATPHYDQTVPVFHRPLEIALVALVLAGVAMAATGAIAAFSHHQAAYCGLLGFAVAR